MFPFDIVVLDDTQSVDPKVCEAKASRKGDSFSVDSRQLLVRQLMSRGNQSGLSCRESGCSPVLTSSAISRWFSFQFRTCHEVRRNISFADVDQTFRKLFDLIVAMWMAVFAFSKP